MSEVTLYLADEQAMSDFGTRIARVTGGHGLIFLEGNLGMGKTTLSRGIIRGLGHVGAVKSPTFTLVQTYALPIGTVHHFDLYRLDGPRDLAELGWDEAREDIVIVEWPDRLGALAPADALRIALAPGETDDARVATLSGWDQRLRTLAA